MVYQLTLVWSEKAENTTRPRYGLADVLFFSVASRIVALEVQPRTLLSDIPLHCRTLLDDSQSFLLCHVANMTLRSTRGLLTEIQLACALASSLQVVFDTHSVSPVLKRRFRIYRCYLHVFFGRINKVRSRSELFTPVIIA